MVAERYHGSRIRSLGYAIWRPIRENTLAAARRFRPSHEKIPAEVEVLMAEVDVLSRQHRWQEALEKARAAAAIVERDGNPRPKRVVGNKLLPLGDCGRGLRLLAEPAQRSRAAEWQGEDLAGHRLFIRQLHTSNMGAPIRMARFVAEGLKRAGRCVVVVEPRLVPLFRRSFPSAEVRPIGAGAFVDAVGDDYITSFEGLGGRAVTDWPSVEATFVPLQADASVTEELRRRYATAARLPVVGFAWGSTNERKDVPDLATWARFLAGFPATFVSLQYGIVGNALKALRGGHDDKLLWDASVDQLVDMDRFAAQVNAMDAVLTISNTGAHLAGALGKRTIIVVDNRVGRGYPAHGERSWWYPDAVLLRKREREWPQVLHEAAERLHAMIVHAPASR